MLEQPVQLKNPDLSIEALLQSIQADAHELLDIQNQWRNAFSKSTSNYKQSENIQDFKNCLNVLFGNKYTVVETEEYQRIKKLAADHPKVSEERQEWQNKFKTLFQDNKILDSKIIQTENKKNWIQATKNQQISALKNEITKLHEQIQNLKESNEDSKIRKLSFNSQCSVILQNINKIEDIPKSQAEQKLLQLENAYKSLDRYLKGKIHFYKSRNQFLKTSNQKLSALFRREKLKDIANIKELQQRIIKLEEEKLRIQGEKLNLQIACINNSAQDEQHFVRNERNEVEFSEIRDPFDQSSSQSLFSIQSELISVQIEDPFEQKSSSFLLQSNLISLRIQDPLKQQQQSISVLNQSDLIPLQIEDPNRTIASSLNQSSMNDSVYFRQHGQRLMNSKYHKHLVGELHANQLQSTFIQTINRSNINQIQGRDGYLALNDVNKDSIEKRKSLQYILELKHQQVFIVCNKLVSSFRKDKFYFTFVKNAENVTLSPTIEIQNQFDKDVLLQQYGDRFVLHLQMIQFRGVFERKHFRSVWQPNKDILMSQSKGIQLIHYIITKMEDDREGFDPILNESVLSM